MKEIYRIIRYRYDETNPQVAAAVERTLERSVRGVYRQSRFEIAASEVSPSDLGESIAGVLDELEPWNPTHLPVYVCRSCGERP